MLRKVWNIISSVLLVIIAVIGILLALPIFLISLPFMRYRERKFDAAFKEYLRTQEGRRYFVYTSRKKTHEFIETSIIPFLDKDIKVVFLEGRSAQTDGDVDNVSTLVHLSRTKGGFPWIIEVSDGQSQTFSLNSAVYKAMNDGDASTVLAMIHA